MSLTNTINYVTPSNFTLSDSDEIEISGSVLTLKQLTTLQTGELVYIPLTTSEEFAARRKTGSAITETEASGGNNSWENNYLNFSSTLDYISIPIDNWAPTSANDYQFDFYYKPAGSGNPASALDLLHKKEVSNDNNRLLLTHAANGTFSVTIWDSAGLYKGAPGASWSPTAGQEYHIAVAMGPTKQEIFIDGVSFASQSVAVTLAAPADGVINIGSNGSAVSHGSFKQFILWDGVQNTTTFTPAIPRQYSSDNPNALVNATTTADSLSSFSETAASKTGSDEFKYTIYVNSIDKYWDGAAWATSDGTYTQASDDATILANISSLDISSGKSIQIRAFAHSDDGLTSPTLTSISYDYGFFNTATTPAMCTISGEVVNLSGNPVEGARIEITNVSGTPYLYDSALVAKAAKTYTDEDGKFEIPLIETATDAKTVDIKAYFYDLAGMEVTKTLASAVTIPNQSSASIEDLV